MFFSRTISIKTNRLLREDTRILGKPWRHACLPRLPSDLKLRSISVSFTFVTTWVWSFVDIHKSKLRVTHTCKLYIKSFVLLAHDRLDTLLNTKAVCNCIFQFLDAKNSNINFVLELQRWKRRLGEILHHIKFIDLAELFVDCGMQ